MRARLPSVVILKNPPCTGFFDGSTTQETFTYRLLDFGGTLTVVPEPATCLGGSLLAGWLLVIVARRARLGTASVR